MRSESMELSGWRYDGNWSGGSVKWHRATFSQLPTTCHVVNGIADLDILEVLSAEMIEFSAPGIAVATKGHRVVAA